MSVQLAVEMIHDADTGESIWLGSEGAIRNEAASYYGSNPVEITATGWMMNVGWDRERFNLKREFLAETGCTSWWESVHGKADDTETKSYRRAWRVRELVAAA